MAVWCKQCEDELVENPLYIAELEIEYFIDIFFIVAVTNGYKEGNGYLPIFFKFLFPGSPPFFLIARGYGP